MRDVAVELRVVAPQAELVDEVADREVPDDVVVSLELLAEDALHVEEREVGHARVAGDFIARRVLQRRDAQVGVAVHRAAEAAVHLNGVLGRGHAVVLDRLEAAIPHRVELVGLGLVAVALLAEGVARVDGAALGKAPLAALLRRPARAGVVVLGPRLLGGGHDVVVVRADDLRDHVVGELADLLGVGDVDGAGALGDDGLELLRAHDGAQAGTGRVVARVHHDGVGQQVLAGDADRADARLVRGEARQDVRRLAGAQAPRGRCVLDGDLVVLDVDEHGRVRGALDDDGVPPGELDARGQHAAAVRIDDHVVLRERGEERDVHTPAQRHARRGQGADGVDELALGGVGVRTGLDLVVDDLVAEAHAADELLVRLGGLGCDLSRSEVDAGHLARPTVRNLGICHVLTLQILQLLCPRAREAMAGQGRATATSRSMSRARLREMPSLRSASKPSQKGACLF